MHDIVEEFKPLIDETIEALTQTDVGYLFLALLIVTLTRILMPLKWSLSLQVTDCR